MASSSPLRSGSVCLLVAVLAFLAGRQSVSTPGFLIGTHADAAGRPAAPAGPDRAPGAFSTLRATAGVEPARTAEARSGRAAPGRASARADAALAERLAALARTDPAGALEEAERLLPLHRREMVWAEIAVAWAETGPAAAWDWAVTMARQTSPVPLRALLRAAAAVDAADAMARAEAVAAAGVLTADDALGVVVRGAAERGAYPEIGALLAARRLGSGETDEASLGLLIHLWAEYEPAAAAAWLAGWPDPATRAATSLALIDRWRDQDPPAAAAHAATLPVGEDRSRALASALTAWLARDAAAAATWLDSQPPHPDLDRAVAAVSRLPHLLSSQPDVALAWAAAVSDPVQRLTAIGDVLDHLARHDPWLARAHIDSLPELDTAERAALAARLDAFSPTPEP